MAVSKILAALFVSMALYEVSVEANVFHVGDSIGWTIGKVNYTLWSETKVFVIGDTIIFEYNKQYHNVMQVNHEDFNSCNTKSPVATFTTGNDSFNIASYGHYYYICGVPGHCQAGQKVDIRVPSPSPSPMPQPKPQPGSPSPSPYSAPPPSWGSGPAPAPTLTPGVPCPPPSSAPAPTSGMSSPPSSEPAPAPDSGITPGPWWGMAPAPAPSPASSIYASVGAFYPSIAVLAYVITAFAY